ncbi:MAG: recombination-associated protein RdgC [Desulfobulbaceae bacterium]|nr:recombination-associated protein RdgC [Desulfobulbaceae bacterium]
MGLLSSSASFVRYAVEGPLPENFWEFAAERIASFSFRDIDDTYDESSTGWVSVMNMFDSSFTYASYAVADYVVLTLRIDERKISNAALKKFTAKEEERIKQERQVPKLARNHRLEIKENMKLMLTKRAVPIPSVYDLCWNLSEGTLLFFSTNKKAQELVAEYFKQTFGLQLVLQIPYITAGHLLDPQSQEQLANLTPSIFV